MLEAAAQIQPAVSNIIAIAAHTGGMHRRARHGALADPSLSAVIELLRSTHHHQPVAIRLITLATAPTPVRDLCAHDIVTLVDRANSVYLVVLLRVSTISNAVYDGSVRTRSHPATLRRATTRSHTTGCDAITIL
jgi:hypothetical protein